ncbi:ABC transporter permease [Bacillus sp. RO1]|uniref:ABC transporter permease n=1 Tax=Bacillus sp. RO1 TaxID=2722703 RepID=UPI0014567AF0|nr:ABC transporter permease [Bacillus sp. RO1]NLP51525.1 ABC transporter permease [Bacillus sp. RO1]
MRAILINHLQYFRRQPFAVIGMIVLTFVFALALGQVNQAEPVELPVFSITLSETEQAELIQALNSKAENTIFVPEKESAVKDKLEKGTIDMGLELERGSYKLYLSATTPNTTLIEAHVANVLQSERTLSDAAERLNASKDELRGKVDESSGMFAVSEKSFKESEFIYDSSLQALFGFSLFFVIFTVTYTVSTILEQKRNGMWNRLVLSPLTKVQLYLGHVSFSFLLGYAQLALVFSFFHFVLGVDLRGGYPMILLVIIPFLFAIVSLGILISAVATNPRQLDAVIPLISVSMAMVGGAYWPLEIVQSEVLLTLSKLIPMTYGMEMLKGATILDWSLSQFLLPASVLFCMGVLFMGIGLNLMERKATV